MFEDQKFIEDNGFLIKEYSHAKDLLPHDERAKINRIKACGGWYGISDVLIINKKAKLSELISSKEDIVKYLSKYHIPSDDTIQEIAEYVWSRRLVNPCRRGDEYRMGLRIAKVPEWYIWLCEKYIGLQ